MRPLLGEELTGSDGSINHMHFPTDDPRMLELEKIGEVNPNDVRFGIHYFIIYLRLMIYNVLTISKCKKIYYFTPGTAEVFFVHLKLELLTQFPALNERKIILFMKKRHLQI